MNITRREFIQKSATVPLGLVGAGALATSGPRKPPFPPFQCSRDTVYYFSSPSGRRRLARILSDRVDLEAWDRSFGMPHIRLCRETEFSPGSRWGDVGGGRNLEFLAPLETLEPYGREFSAYAEILLGFVKSKRWDMCQRNLELAGQSLWRQEREFRHRAAGDGWWVFYSQPPCFLADGHPERHSIGFRVYSRLMIVRKIL